MQYSLTIGIFFASLGLGAYFAKHLDDNRESNFLRVEVYLALFAPIGFMFALWIGMGDMIVLPNLLEQILVRVPIFIIGLLSGFELPILFSMVDSEKAGRDQPTVIDAVESKINGTINRGLNLFFHTSLDSEEYDTYSSVLAMDYLGSLIGALIYAFYLYPEIGLGASVFALAFLNAFAAVVFVLGFSGKYSLLGSTREVITDEKTVVVALCLLVLVGNFVFVLNHESVNDSISEFHTTERIEQEYISDDVIDIEMQDQFRTRYQTATYYERTWTGDSESKMIPEDGEKCLRLDTAIQLCESWAESYHSGLVDVPLSMYENSSDTKVMLAGGGDWIAAKYLASHGVEVDLVDVDREFMERAKDDPFLEQYHNDSYQYENLDVYHQDAYSYLQNTDEEYDVIMLDLPGAKSDDLLHLYSEEFYTLANNHLSEKGVVVTWAYDENTYSQHHAAYANTIREAGFTSWIQYWSYGDFNDDGDYARGERFYILSPSDDRPTIQPDNGTQYLAEHENRYINKSWDTIPTYAGVEPNSQVKPNYDLIVDTTNPNHDENNGDN